MKTNTDFASFVDTLRKLDAKHRMPSGGGQYMMQVALGPSAAAKGRALMRNQKVQPAKTLGLKALMAKCG